MPSKATALACLILLAGAAHADPQFREGADYERLATAQPTGSSSGRVEVIEVFQYGCGGCFRFEPYLEHWAATKPDYVDLVMLPAVWNPLGELHARAFYTAEALGVLDGIHAPFFRAVHVEGNHLETGAALRKLFASFGVGAEAFDATFDSFAVSTKVQRAKELVSRYRIPETPTVVVNGKYLTRAALAQGYDRWFAIIEELAATERSAAAE